MSLRRRDRTVAAEGTAAAREKSVKPALDGLKVVDLSTYLSGPYCGMLLADAVADVIKVERPGSGDEMRRFPPFISGESSAFMLLNRNKRSITFDFKNERDLSALRRLIDRADVLIENFRPGVAERLGLGHEKLRTSNPGLVYCSISGFGQSGPLAKQGGFDLIAQGMSGLMSINREADGTPRRLPIAISDLCAGIFGAFAIQTALYARHATGTGQHLDVSLLESAVALGVYEAASYFATGQAPGSLGQKHRGSAPYQPFEASDGWLTLGAGAQDLWVRLCRVLELDHLLSDPRFVDAPTRVANSDALGEILQERLRQKPRQVWLSAFEEAGIPAGPVLSYDEVYAHPQLRARGVVATVDHPLAGPTRILAPVARLDGTPHGIRRPAPLLGEHTAEIEREFGLGGAQGCGLAGRKRLRK